MQRVRSLNAPPLRLLFAFFGLPFFAPFLYSSFLMFKMLPPLSLHIARGASHLLVFLFDFLLTFSPPFSSFSSRHSPLRISLSSAFPSY